MVSANYDDIEAHVNQVTTTLPVSDDMLQKIIKETVKGPSSSESEGKFSKPSHHSTLHATGYDSLCPWGTSENVRGERGKQFIGQELTWT